MFKDKHSPMFTTLMNDARRPEAAIRGRSLQQSFATRSAPTQSCKKWKLNRYSGALQSDRFPERRHGLTKYFQQLGQLLLDFLDWATKAECQRLTALGCRQ